MKEEKLLKIKKGLAPEQTKPNTQNPALETETLQSKDSEKIPYLPNLKRVLPEKVEVFYTLSETQNTEHGKIIVQAAIKYNKQRTNPFSTTLRGYRKDWNVSEQRFVGKKYEFENSELTRLENDIDAIYRELKRIDVPISADKIKKIYLQETPESTFANVIKSYFETVQTRFNRKEISLETIKNIRARCEKLLKYLVDNNLSNQKIANITTKFCLDYNIFLKGIYKHDVKKRHLQLLNSVLEYAKQNELIKTNPYSIPKSYNQQEVKELIFLSEQELYNLENHVFANAILQQVADAFLLQSYTGFAYCDFKSFRVEYDTCIEQGITWIRKRRQKTKEYSRLPLFPKAYEILKKYNNRIVVMSNDKYNRYLKEVAELLSIDKNLTTHVARKTFGYMYLNLGLQYETVAAMLGHKSILTTQKLYAKVLTNRIAKNLQDIDIRNFVSQNQYETLLITTKS